MFINLTDADNNLVVIMISHIVFFMPDADTENTIINLTGDINIIVKESIMDVCKKIVTRTG